MSYPDPSDVTRARRSSALVERQIAQERSSLAAALSDARDALRSGSGGRIRGGFTVPLLAAGLGVLAAMGVRRFLARR